MAGSGFFDSNYWYRIGTNSTTGPGYALDIVNDGFPNGYADLTLQPVSASGGQYWRFLSQVDGSYQIYSMWPGQDYRLGTSRNNDYAPANHTALYTDESVGHPNYGWDILSLPNETFGLFNPQTMMDLYMLGYVEAWTITEIEPVSDQLSAVVSAVPSASTSSYTCSSPNCTTDATTIIVSPLPASSSIQTANASSISSSLGNLDTSRISQSVAFATFPLTTQSITPSRAADPTPSAPTTAPTPNRKLPMRTVVGISVGAAIGGLLLCLFVVCIFMRRRRRALASHDTHGTDDSMPCHTEAKPELSAQEQQCAEPSSKLSAQDSQCAEPTSKLSTQEHQSAELSGDQGKVPPHLSELGGRETSRNYGSNNSTLLELE